MTELKQQPVLKPVGGFHKREQIWQQIRRQRQFSVNELYVALAHISRDAIRAYVNALVAADVLSPITNEAPFRFALVNDCGVDAPRVRLDGTAVTLGQGNDNMWRTMRILKTFNWQDVALASSTEVVEVKAKTARAYVETLCKAGYLICISQGGAGVKAMYRLSPSKRVGAKAPQIQRGGVLYDPNIGQVVYQRIAKTCEVFNTAQVLKQEGGS
jgi:hypothetical protein